MKIQIALLAVALLAGCSKPASTAAEHAAPAPSAATDAAAAPPSAASDTGTAADMGMTQAEHQTMAQDAAAMGMNADQHAAMTKGGADAAGDAKPDAAAAAQGMGVVKSIDLAAGKVTIAHGPIASLGWPAMTMAFSASPELLKSAKEGEHVEFEFTQHDGASTLSMLQPRK